MTQKQQSSLAEEKPLHQNYHHTRALNLLSPEHVCGCTLVLQVERSSGIEHITESLAETATFGAKHNQTKVQVKSVAFAEKKTRF